MCGLNDFGMISLFFELRVRFDFAQKRPHFGFAQCPGGLFFAGRKNEASGRSSVLRKMISRTLSEVKVRNIKDETEHQSLFYFSVLMWGKLGEIV